MVQSRIKPTVEFKEQKGIHTEDVGHTSPIFQLSYDNTLINITLGKLKYQYMKDNLVYYPIYLVIHNNQVKCQIGVFELPSSKSLEVRLDDLENPLWYSFAAQTIQEFYKPTAVAEKSDISSPGDDFDEHGNPSVLNTNHHPKEIREEGVFTIDLQRHEITLPQETKSEADEIVRSFVGHKQANGPGGWVAQFFKNSHYRINEVEDNGDSFFAAVRDAYQQIGHHTTVAQLRAYVAAHTTQQHYHYYKDKEMIIKTYLDHSTKKSTTRKTTTSSSTNSAKQKHILTVLKSYLGQVLPNDSIETFEQFLQHMQKSTFYADEFTIAVLERLLKVKFVFLSSLSFQAKTPYDVLECHHDIPECRQEPVFQPERYIVLTHDASKNSYQLVSYKAKRIFTFPELPYHIKNMIQIRVSENNAGIFPYIKEFQTFQKSIGVRPLDASSTNKAASQTNGGVILTFHSKSRYSAKPGKGPLESVPLTNSIDFLKLDRISYWRQKLDDAWTSIEDPIVVDGKSYASVNHYMEAAKYFKGLPTIAFQFCLESKSDFAKDLQSFHNRVKQPNEPPLVVDANYSARRDTEYEKVISAKFSKTEMKMILVETKGALLQRYVPRQPAKPATLLMNIRKRLCETETK